MIRLRGDGNASLIRRRVRDTEPLRVKVGVYLELVENGQSASLPVHKDGGQCAVTEKQSRSAPACIDFPNVAARTQLIRHVVLLAHHSHRHLPKLAWLDAEILGQAAYDVLQHPQVISPTGVTVET